jgi:hypothetical protein
MWTRLYDKLFKKDILMKDFVDEKAKFVLAKKKKRLLAILPMVLYETMLKQQFIITIIKFFTLVKGDKKSLIYIQSWHIL